MFQLLDLFSLENGREKKADEGENSRAINAIPGLSRSVLEIIPELWEQQQYDDEYDLDAFLSTLKGTNL